MPIACLDGKQAIYSFRFTSDEWDALAKSNQRERHLRMACCNSTVVLKRSRYGTQFFAHARRGECSTAPESAEHLLAKEIIAQAVEANGWQASVEHRHPDGLWIADVLAEQGGRRIAFEIQLSSQTPTELQRRDDRYRANGVECAWLLKAPRTYSESTAIHAPLFYISFDKDDAYVGPLRRPLEEFVASVLSGETSMAGSGVALHVSRYREARLRLDSVKKVKNVIAAAGEAAGWRAKVDAHYEAWERAPNGAGYNVKKPGANWTIGVFLERNGSRVAFHVEKGWSAFYRSDIQEHYNKVGIQRVCAGFNVQTGKVSADAGDGLHHFRNAEELDGFVLAALARLG